MILIIYEVIIIVGLREDEFQNYLLPCGKSEHISFPAEDNVLCHIKKPGSIAAF